MPDVLQPVLDFLRDQAVETGIALVLVVVSFLAWIVRRVRRKNRAQQGLLELSIEDETSKRKVAMSSESADEIVAKDVNIKDGNISAGRVEARRLERRSWWRRMFGG